MEVISFVVSIIAITMSCVMVWYCHSEITKIVRQTQTALNTMAQQQTDQLEELAKQHGAAIQSVIAAQSKANKNYKQHIEKLFETQRWHSQLLHFQDNETLPVINLNFDKGATQVEPDSDNVEIV